MNDIQSGPIEPADPAHWVDRYGDYLFRYARSRLRSTDATEEVVQETFVAGLNALHQFSGKQGAERAWLLGILKRKIVDFVRRRSRATPLEEMHSGEGAVEALFDRRGNWREDPRMFGANPGDQLERGEFWMILRACLDGLPLRQADVFTLREMEDLAVDDICHELGLSRSNLYVLLHRARLALFHCMKTRL